MKQTNTTNLFTTTGIIHDKTAWERVVLNNFTNKDIERITPPMKYPCYLVHALHEKDDYYHYLYIEDLEQFIKLFEK